ncbi:MAG TPA: proton-conducting transporter membrane subunit, partial [Planctomycetaceae bacterium]|nr:proton-conducting transporter membrane subunit [Planctomycetaceae bacterium]
ELHFPWIGLSLVLPVVGAIVVSRLNNPDRGRKWSIGFTAATLLTTVCGWQDFALLGVNLAADRWQWMSRLCGRELFAMDSLAAPLLPLTALLFFMTTIATLRAKIRKFSFARALASEAIILATFGCQSSWGLIVLLIAGTIPPGLELRARGRSLRIYASHMALFAGLLILGQFVVFLEGPQRAHGVLAIVPLLLAVLIRSGIVPFHCWMTDLFEHAKLGTAVAFVTPIVGAFAAVRLVLPIAPDWALRSMGLVSLVTAVYAAAMALVQRDARRFFCFLFLSHSALVLVGLEMVTPIGLTGGLCMWLSSSLALGGFGLTLRALEARLGRLSLTEYQGLGSHTPNLATCFALTGLASVGFPGTFGFIGTELLLDGAVETYPFVGVAVAVVAALNGIAVVQAYFLLFTGKRNASTVPLPIRFRERYAVLALAAIIFVGGLVPQSGVASRHAAAEAILQARAAKAAQSTPYALGLAIPNQR